MHFWNALKKSEKQIISVIELMQYKISSWIRECELTYKHENMNQFDWNAA